MTSRLFAILAILGLAAQASPGSGSERGSQSLLTIGYLGLADDPRHAERKSYTGVVTRAAIDPRQGAETALREGRVLGRAAGVAFVLESAEGTSADNVVSKAQAFAARGISLVLADLPTQLLAEVARRTRGEGLTLFNVSAYGDALRGRDCQPHLLHVVPSRRMLSDALTQYVASRRWGDVLVLEGPAPEDEARAAAFRRSAARFGVGIADVRGFSLSNDPRERERNNIALLTGGADYDLLYVADAAAELGRHLPFRSYLPRPVIGGEGLMPAGWHWAYERHGAPQLNRRFQRTADRHMTDMDWSAWAATSLIMRAAVATRSVEPARLVAYLKDPELTFDTYKGSPGSFRPWNNQLRQPILLHTANAVIARAPIEGFLHPESYLDTLGADQAESECRLDG